MHCLEYGHKLLSWWYELLQKRCLGQVRALNLPSNRNINSTFELRTLLFIHLLHCNWAASSHILGAECTAAFYWSKAQTSQGCGRGRRKGTFFAENNCREQGVLQQEQQVCLLSGVWGNLSSLQFYVCRKKESCSPNELCVLGEPCSWLQTWASQPSCLK